MCVRACVRVCVFGCVFGCARAHELNISSYLYNRGLYLTFSGVYSDEHQQRDQKLCHDDFSEIMYASLNCITMVKKIN